MDWTELIITAPRAAAPAAEAVATAFADGGLYIEDYADLEKQVWEIAHVDLIEADLLQKPRDVVRIHLYLSPEENAAAAAEALRARLLAAGVDCTLDSGAVRQEDWENSWKQYYHPFPVGARLMVAPSWEDCEPEGRALLRLDPGMAFGTGTHETTLLCLEALDEAVRGGEAVLDVGCGSGILGIAAVLLGAQSALGIDIDPMAVRTANENAARNGADGGPCAYGPRGGSRSEHPEPAASRAASGRVSDAPAGGAAGVFEAVAGDLAGKAAGRYDIITANIVAAAILRLSPDIPARLAPGGLFVASGIIDEREAEVCAGLEKAGLRVTDVRRKRGWVAILAKGDR